MHSKATLFVVSAVLVLCASSEAEVRYRIVPLGDLGRDPIGGSTWNVPSGINEAGQVVGGAATYDSSGSTGGYAVWWDGNGSITTLPTVGVNSSGRPGANGLGINDGGMIVGQIETQAGYRAARWDASTGAITLLGDLGANAVGKTESMAWAVNAGGTTVGYAIKYGDGQGQRAVRWDAGSTSATELQPLSPDPITGGMAAAMAYAVNAEGTTVGEARDYPGGGFYSVPRAVKWAAGSVEPTVLPVVTGLAMMTTNASAYGINDAGVIVGTQYGAQNAPLRWEADGGLTLLGRTLANGVTLLGGDAYDVNNFNVAVGHLGDQAVIWDAAGNPTRLIDLVDPDSGWMLTEAKAINDAGWIVGSGRFGDVGTALPAFNEGFLLIPVPEPASLAVIAAGAAAGLLSRRRRG